jgi:riboflavin synthase
MFTGLVETVGRVVEVTRRGGALRLGVASSLAVAEMERGESVSVDGVCLTVVECRGDRFFADVVQETMRRSTLSDVRPGRRVNLERSLRVGDRVGGHLVQGHVDATATVRAVRRQVGDYRLDIDFVPEIRPYLAFKGSVALQGVSLTVAGLSRDGFAVALVPETLERTTLGDLRTGDRVNVEVDLLARYLERLLEAREAGPLGPEARARGDDDWS